MVLRESAIFWLAQSPEFLETPGIQTIQYFPRIADAALDLRLNTAGSRPAGAEQAKGAWGSSEKK
jgi:hypothetical protein